jgi:hypothetical protein
LLTAATVLHEDGKCCIKNKDDLIDGIVDIVVGEIEVPDFKLDWKTAMRRRAISAHEVLLRHPWATMPIVSSRKAIMAR